MRKIIYLSRKCDEKIFVSETQLILRNFSQLEADSARILAESPFLLESMPNSCNDPEIEETEIQDFRPEECATLPVGTDTKESSKMNKTIKIF